MAFSIDPMNKTASMLDLIAQRQKALGENLANIDTPGYVRKDVDFSQCLGKTDSSLETRMSAVLGQSNVMQDDAGGGQVNPAHELLELQKNSLLYTMATREMSSMITQMKTVVNVGK